MRFTRTSTGNRLSGSILIRNNHCLLPYGTQYAGLTSNVVVTELIAGEVVKKSVPTYELLTSHTARHTFATQSLLRGMPVEVLQKVMIHANIQTTLLYAKVVEDLQHNTTRRIWEDQGAATDSAGGRASQVCAVEPLAA